MKTIFVSIFIFCLLAAGTGVSAQVNVSSTSGIELPSPGMTPDSPFYFLKTWKESIQTFFTFGAEQKANQFLHLSEVRLAEYLKMAEKGKTEIASTTLEKYKKQLDRALEKASEKGIAGEEILKEKILKHQDILKNTQEKASEVAKPEIQKAVKAFEEVKIKIDQKIEEGLKDAPAEVQSCFKLIISKASAGEIKNSGDIQALLSNCFSPGTKIPSGETINAGFLEKIKEFYGKNLPQKDSESLDKVIKLYKDGTLKGAEMPSGQKTLNLEDIKNLQEKMNADMEAQYKKLTPEELEYLKKMQEQGQLETQTQIEGIPTNSSGMGL